MDEARRFLRYVIPGLIFVIEIILCLLISSFDQFVPKLTCLLSSDKTSIGTIAAVFLTSGALGYIFSNIYYFFNNLGWGSVDQRNLLYNAEKQGWLKFIKDDDIQLHFTKLGAWRVVTALWKSKIETSTRIKSADKRTDDLADILHGLGASVVASVLAALCWMFVYNKVLGNLPMQWWPELTIVLIIFIGIVLVFSVNYRRARKSIEGIVYIILSEELRRGWPVEIDVNKYGLPPAVASANKRNKT